MLCKYLSSSSDGSALFRLLFRALAGVDRAAGHLTRMGDPLLATYVEAYDDIHGLQLADMPGRVEVGAGEIDFVPLLAHALRRLALGG